MDTLMYLQQIHTEYWDCILYSVYISCKPTFPTSKWLRFDNIYSRVRLLTRMRTL